MLIAGPNGIGRWGGAIMGVGHDYLQGSTNRSKVIAGL
jgi:hypothetical protein